MRLSSRDGVPFVMGWTNSHLHEFTLPGLRIGPPLDELDDEYGEELIDEAKIATEANRIIVTKDSDFPDSFFLKGAPPRLIYLRLGNLRNRELTAFLEAHWSMIKDLLSQDSGMLVLSREQFISY